MRGEWKRHSFAAAAAAPQKNSFQLGLRPWRSQSYIAFKMNCISERLDEVATSRRRRPKWKKMQISDGMEGGGAQRFITRRLLSLLMNTSVFDRPLGDKAGDQAADTVAIKQKNAKSC